jgi:hypothetical protein
MGLKVLAGIASNENAPAAARVSAVALLFERGWGKPPQPHSGEDGDGRVVVEIVYRDREGLQAVEPRSDFQRHICPPTIDLTNGRDPERR